MLTRPCGMGFGAQRLWRKAYEKRGPHSNMHQQAKLRTFRRVIRTRDSLDQFLTLRCLPCLRLLVRPRGFASRLASVLVVASIGAALLGHHPRQWRPSSVGVIHLGIAGRLNRLPPRLMRYCPGG